MSSVNRFTFILKIVMTAAVNKQVDKIIFSSLFFQLVKKMENFHLHLSKNEILGPVCFACLSLR